MRLGWYISGAGHGGLILAILFGGLFVGERIPEPVSLSEVSILSEEDFAALSPPNTAPDTQTDAPEVAVPDEDNAPDAPVEDDAPNRSEAEPIEQPDKPTDPDVAVEQLAPNAVVVEDAPVTLAAPSDLDGTTVEPDQVAAPAPRVAPVPQVAPPPEAETGPELIQDTAPAPEAPPEEPVEEAEPTAPEQASDRIVTEAEQDQNYAPASSRRPRARPARPVRVAEPAPEPEEQTTNTDDAVAAALADDAPSDVPVSRGPPLTGGEKDAFVVAVGNCWIVDTGSQAAGVKVTVGFELDRSGKVVGDIRQISVEGGDSASQRSAFEKARRAILRCQKGGYALPVEKFEQWREIEATFNPQGMQFR